MVGRSLDVQENAPGGHSSGGVFVRDPEALACSIVRFLTGPQCSSAGHKICPGDSHSGLFWLVSDWQKTA